MTYVSLVDIEFTEPPVIALDGLVQEFPVGYDLEVGQIVVMSCMLFSAAAYWPDRGGLYDFKFGLRIKQARRPQHISAPDYSKEAVDRYIPREERGKVLEGICRAAILLVSAANAAEVTMGSYYPYPPEKALEKYRAIAERVVSLGYDIIDEYTDHKGRRQWYLRRAEIGREDESSSHEPSQAHS